MKTISIFSFLLIFTSLFFVGCGNDEFNFEAEDVYAIYFSVNYGSANDKSGYINRSDSDINSEAIDEACKILLEEVEYSHKMQEKEFWSRKEVEYKEPADGVNVTFFYEDGSYNIKIYSDRVYKYGIWDRYSDKGSRISTIVQRNTLTVTDNIG